MEIPKIVKNIKELVALSIGTHETPNLQPLTVASRWVQPQAKSQRLLGIPYDNTFPNAI